MLRSPLMNEQIPNHAAAEETSAFPRPAFEVIPLDCEITAYAPDGDDPLF